MAKIHWTGATSHQITKISLYKDVKHHVKGWGIVHKEGVADADAPKKVRGVHKHCWKYVFISNGKKPGTLAKVEYQAA